MKLEGSVNTEVSSASTISGDQKRGQLASILVEFHHLKSAKINEKVKSKKVECCYFSVWGQQKKVLHIAVYP